jgi:uncharacterized protein (TIGR02453 family)
MFNGFTKETSDFLWELAFNNERPWFLEHKAQFEQVLNQPFKELANQTAELMALRFPKRGFQLHVSRIYRDARRLFGRGPYKDHLWFSLKSDEILLEGPMFWFEVGAADFSYGMGFYSATPAQMEEFRKAVDANPARFERIVKKLMKDKRLRITGEEYARAKGHHNDIIDQWYNRKRIGIEVCQDFGGDVLSANLPEILVDCYEELLPMYDFFMEFYRNGL